jgi:3'-phosphoadenosine 5'-phosphosulfate sulfotransferase (PAPS reductase)/FAD synthetase
VHPIIDWSRQDVSDYLRTHDLPEHPLQSRGYVSIGDVHTTQILLPGMREEDTRFFGLKRECSAPMSPIQRLMMLLLGHRKLESTVRCLGIEVDDALEIAERTEC